MNEEQQYQKGFNHGYLLEQYEPTLSQKLATDLLQGPAHYTSGMKAGREEYQQEESKDQLADLKAIRDKDKTQDRDLEL